jgi:hypothetical protein
MNQYSSFSFPSQGRLLKEFGFLSDGDLIEVKPSELKGQAQGEAASRTAALIESAKGKVLFIGTVPVPLPLFMLALMAVLCRNIIIIISIPHFR